MKNPTKEGNYTTIFKDGSIIHENPWLIFPDGHGKWYWNEECRGGVVAWNEIPEGGYNFHRWYRLPEDELRELLFAAAISEALTRVDIDYYDAIEDYCSSHKVQSIEELINAEMAYYSGYECT